MDTAEHMFSKCKELQRQLEPSTAESMADMLFEIGDEFTHKRNFEVAVKWLERAHDVIGEQAIEKLSPDAGELRLTIMQRLGWYFEEISYKN